MSDEPRIAPPTAFADQERHTATVRLSFGPEATIVPTPEGDGFTVLVLRSYPTNLSIPVLKARVTFGPDLKPTLEWLKVEP